MLGDGGRFLVSDHWSDSSENRFACQSFMTTTCLLSPFLLKFFNIRWVENPFYMRIMGVKYYFEQAFIMIPSSMKTLAVDIIVALLYYYSFLKHLFHSLAQMSQPSLKTSI
jgi:hypothetical protein